MNNKIFFFSDIDNTLIQTKRKTDFSKDTIVASFNRDGEESSYFYRGTKLFIDKILDSGIILIPTTARSISSYNRTIFANESRIKYVILNFGATIIIDGKIDIEWQRDIAKRLLEVDLEKLYDEVREVLNIDLDIKIIDGYYINIHNKIALDNLEIKNILEEFIKNRPYLHLHHNDNSFAILPIFINKKLAVEYLIDIYNPTLTLGAGDNKSDLDFMKITDFKLIPKGFLT